MRKRIAIAGCILLGALTIFSFVQYKNNMDLKVRLGGIYRSNIMDYKVHIIQMSEYLKNEEEFNRGDLRSLYSKANMLTMIELPSRNVISLYETQIQHYASKLESLVSEGNNPKEIETARYNALQLLASLESGLVDMLNAGIVQNRDGSVGEDSMSYYQIGLPDSKIMKTINENLDKALEGHYVIP